MDEILGAKQGDPRYVPALDGVRAIAVLSVFLLHLARDRVPGGAFGVDVFFVLSAFLITSLLIDEFDAHGRVDFVAFYWRRAFRLLPALLLWLVFASITAVLGGDAHRVPLSAAGALFYVSDFLQAWTDLVANAFDQAWSLSVEEQFYFVWPALLVLVLLRCPPRQRRWILGIAVPAAAVVAFTRPNYFLPTGHLLPLVIGCWAADQRARGLSPWIASIARSPWTGYVALAIFTAAALLALPPLLGAGMFVLIAIATAALLLHLTNPGTTGVGRLLGSAVPRWIGARSYGVYLYGLTMMGFVGALFPGITLRFAAPLDVALTLIVVALSYRLVESPVRRAGRAWLRRRRGESGASAPALTSP